MSEEKFLFNFNDEMMKEKQLVWTLFQNSVTTFGKYFMIFIILFLLQARRVVDKYKKKRQNIFSLEIYI